MVQGTPLAGVHGAPPLPPQRDPGPGQRDVQEDAEDGYNIEDGVLWGTTINVRTCMNVFRFV